jgi:stage II sporulation protein GA (sporulation sigma-E factor processing peptidase)
MDFLLAIKPDLVTVIQSGTRFETARVLVGLNPDRLAADQQYQAIIHPALLQCAAEESDKSLEQEG